MDTNAAPGPATTVGGIRPFPPTEPRITGDPSGRLPLHDTSHIRAAAHHAKRAYPGAIGELLARELTAHAEFGYRFAANGLLTRLATEVLRTSVPAMSGRSTELKRSIGGATGAETTTSTTDLNDRP
jgi:hypothetical protein